MKLYVITYDKYEPTVHRVLRGPEDADIDALWNTFATTMEHPLYFAKWLVANHGFEELDYEEVNTYEFDGEAGYSRAPGSSNANEYPDDITRVTMPFRSQRLPLGL